MAGLARLPLRRLALPGSLLSFPPCLYRIQPNLPGRPSCAPPFFSLPPVVIPQEVLLWTRRDSQGTAHETHNRTWFYFGISGGQQVSLGVWS